MKRPITLYILFFLHIFLIVGAFIGGSMMIYEPNGSLLGLETDRLHRTVFPNYFIPGILLLLSNGIFPLIALIGLLFKPNWKKFNVFNIYSNTHWGWTYSLYTGIIVITWITVQLLLTAYFWMHAAVIFLALIILIFTLMPQHIRYYKRY